MRTAKVYLIVKTERWSRTKAKVVKIYQGKPDVKDLDADEIVVAVNLEVPDSAFRHVFELPVVALPDSAAPSIMSASLEDRGQR